MDDTEKWTLGTHRGTDMFQVKKTLKTKIRDRFILIKTSFKHESNLRPWYTSSATLLVFPTRTNDQPSWLLFTRCGLYANRIIAPPHKVSSPKNVCVLCAFVFQK